VFWFPQNQYQAAAAAAAVYRKISRVASTPYTPGENNIIGTLCSRYCFTIIIIINTHDNFLLSISTVADGTRVDNY